MAVSMRKGVQIGYGQRVLSPKDIANLAAWYDVSDGASLLKSNGSQVTTVGDTVALITDKSGNSTTNCLCLNGVAGNYASTPDSAALDILGDIEIQCDVVLNDWTPTINNQLVTKYKGSSAAYQAFAFYVDTVGKLRFYWSPTGVTAGALESVSTVAPSISDLGRLWVRVTLDVDNGTGGNDTKFWTSNDGSNWVQLGSTITKTGTTSIFNSVANVNLGAHVDGVGENLAGRIYRAKIYNGISGTLVFDANFGVVSKLATSFAESSSNAATVTINSSGATGARISGERDLVNLTAASQPTYLPWSGTNYGYLNSISGNYFSSPDSAAVSIAGDIDIRARIQYAGGLTGVIIARDNISSQRSYNFNVRNTNILAFYWTTDGTSGTGSDILSTAAITSFDQWVRVTLDVDNGAGGYDVKFWTSSDGVTWTQLGATVTGGSTTSIFNGTAELRIGATGDGLNRLAANFYRAQIYNGINGTLAFDFNPATYISGTTFLDSSSNAATITLNGGATIVTKTCLYFDGSNDYAKSAAFSLSQPESVYFTGSQISWTSGDYLLDGNAANSGAIIQTTTTPQLNINAGSSVAANTGLGVSIFGVLTAIFNAASSFLRVNRASSTSGNAGASNMSGLTVGASATPGNYGNMAMNELLVYSAAQDLTTQNLLVTYEGAKWRINVAA